MPFVDLALARRLEMAHAWRSIRYARAQSALRPETLSAVHAAAGGYAVYAGDGSPLNKAVGLGFEPITGAALDCVEQFYRSHHISPRVDLCPLADPSLLNLLKQGGYRLDEFFNVLVRSLSDAILSPPLPAWMRITQASEKEADVWLRAVAQGFTGESPPQDAFDVLGPNVYSENSACFFAWVDGQPAGGGAMFIHEGVVELGSASTRPAFRKRGVQTALILARLAAAREAGCDLAMVLTSPATESQRNVERAGFRLAYTKVIVEQADPNG